MVGGGRKDNEIKAKKWLKRKKTTGKPLTHMVVELLNPPTSNKKSCNIHPTTHQPQPQYDNNLKLLEAR